MLFDISRTTRLALTALTLASGTFANAEDWTAPDVIEGNPVLSFAVGKWGVPEGQAVMYGPDASSTTGFVLASDEFWNSVIVSDQSGILFDVGNKIRAADWFLPPLSVWFANTGTFDRELLKSLDGPAALTTIEWLDSERRVLIVNPRDFDDGVPASIMIIFKLDEDSGERSNICHARQTIMILYTGDKDEAALRECLQNNSSN